MEVIGADGVHLGTVDRVEGDRIKLTKADSGVGASRRPSSFHLRAAWSPRSKATSVRLSANADVAAALFEEEEAASRSSFELGYNSAKFRASASLMVAPVRSAD